MTVQKIQSLQPVTHEKLKPAEFENKWQQYWREHKTYQPDMRHAKKPFYNLMMFPYPSAEGLHVGNMYAFTGVDVYGRFKRMQGHDVFEPIGLDGFGIHSENYAIKIGKHPLEQAKISQENFYRQLTSIGDGFAWENRLETYDPQYYKWTQWVFAEMFRHGLAYRKKSPVNFCPSCKTVLSDEQVIDGLCERCKSEVEKREMEQWFFRITDYAERLLNNTYKTSFAWSEKVRVGQQHWIGKKEGINIDYPVVTSNGKPTTRHKKPITITCFTTRPDTNFGATFVVIAPEHPFVKEIQNKQFAIESAKLDEINAYVEITKSKSEADRIAEGKEKTGVFTGFYCVNGLTGRQMPLWISDFVLAGFGTGAVVGVPGHDIRDFQFAKKFGIDIIRVVVGEDGDKSEITREEQIQEEDGTMIHSGFLNGMDIHEAKEKIKDYLEEKKMGKKITTFRLRDWCISRQRYWGAPIPMVYCESCAKKNIGWLSLQGSGVRSQDSENKIPYSRFQTPDSSVDLMPGWYPVDTSQLPVELPPLDDWKPEGTGKGPLAKVESFVRITCPQCGGEARRETDVCDTFLDSSWYFLRYPSLQAEDKADVAWNTEITKKWLPVTQYIGGAEHTVLHLLYARFVTMAFHDFGFLDFEEPFSRFFAHGLIIKDGAKMSKSKGNVVVPDEYIGKYGADTLRSYLMFLGPFESGGDFRDTGIAGMYKFLSRVWRLASEHLKHENAKSSSSHLDKMMHKTIKEVTEDMEHLRYNTAIAHIMEYVNELGESGVRDQVSGQHIKTLLLLLAPFAPHMTEELWSLTHHSQLITHTYVSVHTSDWPTYDPKMLIEDSVTIVVQTNGKLRVALEVSVEISRNREEIEKLARASETVARQLASVTVRNVIFVPGKLINFVV